VDSVGTTQPTEVTMQCLNVHAGDETDIGLLALSAPCIVLEHTNRDCGSWFGSLSTDNPLICDLSGGLGILSTDDGLSALSVANKLSSSAVVESTATDESQSCIFLRGEYELKEGTDTADFDASRTDKSSGISPLVFTSVLLLKSSGLLNDDNEWHVPPCNVNTVN
jgi:hypothetical protein